MKIWYCATCGYEVESRGRCHRCRQKLVASPLPALEPAAAEDDEVGYRLEGWADRTRGRLIEALVAAGVRHRFEDDELVVGVDDEDRTDALVAEVGEGAADDEVAEDEWEDLGDATAGDAGTDVPGGGAGAGERAEAGDDLRTLWRAASRLRLDPTDMEADGDVAEVSATVFVLDEGPGADPETWAAIGRVTRRLLAALGADEALEDEIRREAAVLATLLGPVVGEGPATTNGASPTPAAAVPAAAGAPVAGTAVAAGPEEAAGDGDGDAAGDGDVDGEGEAVDDGRRLLGGGPETSYEVPGWLPDQRALLSVLLEERAIPHAWDGADLVVPSTDETEVEALFDRVGGVGDPDEEDEARYRALEELFAAVTRLAGAPDDEERSADVLERAGAVEGPTPFGFDDGRWLDLRRRTRTLADALEHGADTDTVAAQAAALRDLLRSLV